MRAFGYGAGVTVLALQGGLILGFAVGALAFDLIPGHSLDNPQPVHTLIAALPTLGGFLLGGAVWGVLMRRLADAPDRKRMAIAGVLGFAPISLVLAMGLGLLEPIAVERLGAQFPIHRIFTLFFVPAAFLIASVSAYALGVGLRNYTLARQLFWRVGFAAALAFLAVNLAMEALGWEVGGPNAAARATMLTVLLVSNLAAAIVAGGVMGVMLVGERMGGEKAEFGRRKAERDRQTTEIGRSNPFS